MRRQLAAGSAAAAPLRRALSASTRPDTVQLHVNEAGHGRPPVVFVHGLLGSGTNFRTVQTAVAKAGRHTLAVDLRNHGRSPHTHTMTLDDLAADVAAVIERHAGGQPVTLLGHSLGGKTAMRLAQARPELLQRLIVVDIAPVAYTSANPGWLSVQRVVQAAASLDPTKCASRTEVDAKLAHLVPEPGVRSFVAQNLTVQPGGGYAWRINWKAILGAMPSFAAWPPVPPTWARPEAKAGAAALDAHFIAGEHSTYLRPEHHGAIAQLFPRAQHHVVAGAGHWVHAEQPKLFWELLSRLLELPAEGHAQHQQHQPHAHAPHGHKQH